MSGLTWLHLSDWHQKGKGFDRSVVLNKLKDDIENRSKIHSDLEKIDFIVFSGDLTFSGKKEEFEAARDNFLEPVRLAAGVDKDRVFIVPGNHDMNRDLFKYLPPDLTKPLTTHEAIIEWLDDEMGLEEILKPFKEYRQFVHQYAGDHLSPYAFGIEISIDGKSIAIMGFNSALMCGRNIISNNVDDYGKIILGEPQIHDILRKYESAHIRIAVMHHPMEWLTESDRDKVEGALKKAMHIILCGHLHKGRADTISGTDGQCMIIPAGSAYDRREYPNAFNYLHLDTETGKGIVYLRRWSTEESIWEPYHKSTHPNGQYPFILPGFTGDEYPQKPDLTEVTEGVEKPETISGPGAMFNLDNFVFNVPFRAKGEGMVGREDALLKVREQLEKGKHTAIGHTAAFQGMGGLGKTQLAVEYAHKYKDKYPKGIIWINADQEIDPQLIDIAKKAKWISPESKHSEILETALHRLRNWSECLVIFDNVEKYEDIENYLPAVDAQPHLLVTSREVHSNFVPVEILLLDNDRSLELLMKESNRDFSNISLPEKEAARSVVDQLGGLPLAIEIAGAYLSHMTGCTFSQYKTLLEANLKEALKGDMLSSCTKHECDLYATLKISESLVEKSPLLKEIIDFLAWSSSAFMGVSLIATVLDKTEAELIHPLSLGVTIKILQQSENGKRFDLHRLVRKVQQEQNPITVRKDWVDQVCGRLGKWFEDRSEEFIHLPEFEAEIDHLKEWLDHAENLFPEHVARLTWLQSYPPFHWGKYNESHQLVQSAFSMLDQVPNVDLKLKADILNNLGTTSSLLGKNSDSISYHKQALDIHLKLFGEQHQDTATSYNNIGITLGQMGKHEEALKYHEKALAIQLQVLGEQHPNTASSYNNIGNIYYYIGKQDEALKYQEKALAIRRQVLGEQHRDTATSYNNIGSNYEKMGKHDEALQYKEKALAIQLKILGEQHPITAAIYNNIGSTYGEMGKYKEALEYYEKALAIRLKFLGEQHKDTATSYHNIGYYYREMGKYDKALNYFEKANNIWLQVLGEQHKDTSDSAVGMIQCLIKLKRFDEAMEKTEEWLGRLPKDHQYYKAFEVLKKMINKAKRNKLSGISSKKKRR